MPTPRAQAHDNHITLHFDSLDDALRLFTPWRGAGPRIQAASQIHSALAAAGLAVDVQVNGRSVAQLGDGRPSGVLFTLLQPAA